MSGPRTEVFVCGLCGHRQSPDLLSSWQGRCVKCRHVNVPVPVLSADEEEARYGLVTDYPAEGPEQGKEKA